MKMIDQLADFQAAVDDTAKAVGIHGEPVLVHPERDRKSALDLLLATFPAGFPPVKSSWINTWGFTFCGSSHHRAADGTCAKPLKFEKFRG